MNNGLFKHRISLIRRELTGTTAHGEKQYEWVEYTKVWSRFRQSGSKLIHLNQQDHHKISAVVNMRYRPELLESDRVRYKGVDYEIDSSSNPDERQRFHELLLRAVK